MDRFSLRRAVERLRDGLFDPVAAHCLTMGKEKIENIFYKALTKKEESKHLCICCSYGQGKSHTLTYLNQFALKHGYATCFVQLDIREVPFHQFAVVYRSIMQHLSLPDGKTFSKAWKNYSNKDCLKNLDFMPHRFKMTLIAMLNKNKQITSKTKSSKINSYNPKEYDYWLDKVLMGHELPVSNLKNICKNRDVENYKTQSLHCKKNDSYVLMIQSLGIILKKLGYKGLVLLFDEAESIAQLRLASRAKSYHLLDQFFQGKDSIFSIFAFTDDFFDKVENESYDEKKDIFALNYAQHWHNLNILRLNDFSSNQWKCLLDRLIQLYSQAYQIEIPFQLKSNLQSFLDKLEIQDIRFRLKALVNKLDIETQKILMEN
jgi:BREX system ATP-binding protein BrxC/D